MAKQDYGQLAKEVVDAVGGKENIISVTNCMTPVSYTHLTLPTIYSV